MLVFIFSSCPSWQFSFHSKHEIYNVKYKFASDFVLPGLIKNMFKHLKADIPSVHILEVILSSQPTPEVCTTSSDLVVGSVTRELPEKNPNFFFNLFFQTKDTKTAVKMAMSDQDVQKQVLNILDIPKVLILQPVNLFTQNVILISWQHKYSTLFKDM